MAMKIAHLLVLILTSVGLALTPSTTLAGGRAAGSGVVVVAPHGSVIVTSPSAVVVHAAPKVFVGTPLVHPHPFVTRPFSPFGVFATPVFAQPAPSVFPRPLDPWRFWPPGTVVPRLFFGSSFFRFGHSFFPSVTSAPVTGVYTSPVYASTPAYHSQPVPVPVPAPAPLPTPTVIEYPTGWYQLRGDGLSTPYVWVWDAFWACWLIEGIQLRIENIRQCLPTS